MASEVSPNWLRSVPSCTSAVAWCQGAASWSLLRPWSNSLQLPCRPQKKTRTLAAAKRPGSADHLARPFSDLFNVAASRPAKSPRGALMPPARPSSLGRVSRRRGQRERKRARRAGSARHELFMTMSRVLRPVWPSVVDRLDGDQRPGPMPEQRAGEEGEMPVCHQAIAPRRKPIAARLHGEPRLYEASTRRAALVVSSAAPAARRN